MEFKYSKTKKQKITIGLITTISIVVVAYIMPALNLTVISAIGPFIYALVCLYYLSKYTLASYIYTFNDEDLVIIKKTGRKLSQILKLSYSDITCVEDGISRARHLSVGRFDKSYLTVCFKENKTKYKYKIHKSEELIDAFKSKNIKIKINKK